MRRAFAEIIPCLPGLANRNKQLHSDVCRVPWGGHGYSQFPVFQWTFQSIAHPKFSGLKGSLFYYFLWFCCWWEWFFYLWVNATWCLQSDGNPPDTASLGWSHPCLMIGFVSARVMGMTQPWVMFSELRQKWVSSPASLVSLAVHSDQGAPKGVREWIPVFKCFSASASITFAKVPLTTWARSNSRCKSKIPSLDERSCKVISGKGASVRVGDICGHFSNVLRMSRWIPLSKEFFLPISSPATGPVFHLPRAIIWSCWLCPRSASEPLVPFKFQICGHWLRVDCALPMDLAFVKSWLFVIVGCCFSFLLPICPSMLPCIHTSVFSSFLSFIHPSINASILQCFPPAFLPPLPSFFPSLHPFIHVSMHPSICQYFLPSFHSSMQLSIFPIFLPFIYLSLHLFIIHPYTHLILLIPL